MTRKDRGDTKYSLFMRWMLANAFGVALVVVAWKTGWIRDVIAMDAIYVSRGIVVYFLIAMINCAWKILETSRELNVAQDYVLQMRMGNKNACSTIEKKDFRVSHHLSEVRGLSADGRREMGDIFAGDLAGNLNSAGYSLARLGALGSIGMLFGIGVALKVFEVPLTDPSQAITVFNKIPAGLRIAVYPALIAGIAAYWLDYPFEILDDGTRKLVLWIKKAAVYHAEQQSV